MSTIALSLSACELNDSSDVGLPTITITNPASSSAIKTPDNIMNFAGTAESEVQIESVTWINDRGGQGIANGKENWTTGNIVLQLGINNITITANDVLGNSNSNSVSVDRDSDAPDGVNPNNTPTISGTPPHNATVGMEYSFKPTAVDVDGDTMNFSIVNKPSWITFNSTTGGLRGTPSSDEVDIYIEIVITVSDGQSSASLPKFSISVEQWASGSATLSWTAPTERIDNTPLTDLAGYQIHYGQSPGSYSNQITINNPGITTYVVENLSSGTWQFAVSAFDSAGQFSEFSNEGQKNIP